ncbi:MAG TPA: hypothetical protein H9874_10025 [Candidatus Bilophila faecipullorum]|uniref:Uncharacterized protein n=1 Tax=Candidatus Bilophila faecipullorum TaxID=2838482 RepID=A0A9D1R3K0_9BACT|nr:hypothetical protein [uncultured Bilophila sp.]HIW79462.1 hypothetical protein [Candidatus Bilophila faecipullorum]
METAHSNDTDVLRVLARIEKKVDDLKASVDTAQEQAATGSVLSGGLSGAVIAVAVVYAQAILGVRA